MALPPARTELVDTYPNPSNAVAKAGLGKQYDFVTSIAYGQCRLAKSGANVVLSRYNGSWLTINGVVREIPAAGVSLAPTGLPVGTLCYVYAWMNGSTMTLEAVTTAHVTDATSGMEIKTSDASRTLVGMVRAVTGPAFADTDAQRFVVSWFNRRRRRLYISAGSPVVNGNTTPVPLLGNVEFLTWGDETIEAKVSGGVLNNTINAVCGTALSFDSNSAFAHAPVPMQAYAANANGPCSGGTAVVPSEGYHFFNVLGNVSNGVGTWAAGLEISGAVPA